jgi:16S rRNA (uracil1498-N3)-methyltransferase
LTRIYVNQQLQIGAIYELPSAAANHVANVLRLAVGDKLVLFNGEGGEFSGVIESISKRRVIIKTLEFIDRQAESPLKIHLGQGIARGEKMDFIIQKAVELGVTTVTPLITARCNVHLNPERLAKKLERWQKIAISACEQCGRNFIPTINQPEKIADWIVSNQSDLALILSPYAEQSLTDLAKKTATISVLIGPEGGLNTDEIQLAKQHKFLAIKLGPRILRTETAGLVTLSLLQARWGDLN